MKKFIYIVLLTSLTTSVYAKDGRMEKCKDLEDMARAIMTIRQKGISMSKTMDLTSNSEIDDGSKEIVNMMVVEAYERTRYSSESMRKDIVDDFANETFLICIKPDA